MSGKANALAQNVGRLALFSFWFCFMLWPSHWLTTVIGLLEERILPAGTPGIVQVAIFVFSWTVCVWLLAWIPIWWARRRRLKMVRSNGRNAAFLMLLLACTIYCTFAWDKYVADKLYICNDSVPYVFLHPGDWVHGDYVTVPRIVTPRSMSEPDAIKEGWSVAQLWLLWWSWVAASIGVSALLAFLIWWPRTRRAGTDSMAA
jgi:hypothetical protein